MEAQQWIASRPELADDPEPRPVAVPFEPSFTLRHRGILAASSVRTRFCDELPFGFGWIADEPPRLERASHALVDDGRVWLVDPVDDPALEERIAASGRVVGVIQLLDRHGRDAAALAARYDVPVHLAPRAGVPDSPFQVLRAVDLPTWREAALWWPERSTLVVADALGTASYFLAPGRASRGAPAPAPPAAALARRARLPSTSSAATVKGFTGRQPLRRFARRSPARVAGSRGGSSVSYEVD